METRALQHDCVCQDPLGEWTVPDYQEVQGEDLERMAVDQPRGSYIKEKTLLVQYYDNNNIMIVQTST